MAHILRTDAKDMNKKNTKTQKGTFLRGSKKAQRKTNMFLRIMIIYFLANLL